MLVIRLRGGLGNQLFQYAAAFRLASVNGLALGVDKDTGFPNDPYGRKYSLEHFSITGRVLDELEARQYLSRYRRSRLTCKILEYCARRVQGRTLVNSLANLKTRGGMLEGYFHHPGYFADVTDQIREEFRFSATIHPSAYTLCEKMTCSESVALHVRRFHGNTDGQGPELYGLPPSYYQKALQLMREHIKSPQIFLFGDHPEWAQNSLQFANEVTVVKHESANSDIEDLRLMAKCKHHIISNSTFSWWGAWLATQGGMVCCPADFSPDLKGRYRDAYPLHWLVL